MAASAHAVGLPFDVDAARHIMASLARVNPEALVARLRLRPRPAAPAARLDQHHQRSQTP